MGICDFYFLLHIHSYILIWDYHSASISDILWIRKLLLIKHSRGLTPVAQQTYPGDFCLQLIHWNTFSKNTATEQSWRLVTFKALDQSDLVTSPFVFPELFWSGISDQKDKVTFCEMKIPFVDNQSRVLFWKVRQLTRGWVGWTWLEINAGIWIEGTRGRF